MSNLSSLEEEKEKNESNKDKQQEEVLEESEIKSNLETLEEFCASKGWKLLYSDKKEDHVQGPKIILYEKRKPEILFYIFLHEVGHVWMTECDFTYEARYPELTRNPIRYATVTYKIAKIQEEIEAWEIGKKLAKSLGLRINESKFEKIRAQCLTTYMNWAVRTRNSKKKKKLNAANNVV